MKTAFQFYPEGFDIFFLILQDPIFDNFCQWMSLGSIGAGAGAGFCCSSNGVFF